MDRTRGHPLLVTTLIVLLLDWFFRPWFHGLVMGFYRNPVLVYIILLAAAVILFSPKGSGTSVRRISPIVLGVLFVLLLTLLFLASSSANTALYKDYHPSLVRGELNLSTSHIRILPKFTAYRYAIDTIEYARYTLSDGHLTMLNGTPVWGFYIVPDGAWNSIRLKDKGVLFVDMGTTQAKMKRIEEELQVGPGMQFFDNLNWVLYKKHYLVDLDLPRALYYNGRLYIVVPYISYDFRVFYTVPKWGGVFIVDEDGNVEDLSPDEAVKDERLRNFPIFPERLVRDVVEAQNYWKDSVFANINNLWLHHENQIELIDVSNQGNRQPFLVVASDGRKYWMTAVEPYGKAHGLAAIYLMDARTGEMTQVKFETPLTGPVKAIDYVKKALPTFDWSQFMAVEPIPVFIDGTLWWRIAIIPRSGSGVAKIAFVNAETKDVKIFEDEREVREFLFKGEVVQTEEVKGEVEAIYSYIKDCNTHWILVVGDRTLYTSASDLSDELILKLLSLKLGDNVKVVISEGRIVDIKR
ncbi:hypothetical protein [Thermococcus stetteri]|uniref:hypothetical protein n=1 Tax=Thermococcus stetteri TaxID=49900 RepID=UPI001AE6549E|nr:hypothetical protein [Thermococcus stetteri]MBP1911227.1 hypothetical protein [Thermococcus stetteri]